MYQSRDLERISKAITSEIEDQISMAGIFYRIFNRVKISSSTEAKILDKGHYDGKTKFIRDIIGIRVILYFSDDLNIIYKCIKDHFELVEETIDKNEETKFAPTRVNLIFRIPKELQKEFKDIVKSDLLDSTFELQLRTIFSEGWHEVDHDLRYKCTSDWEEQKDLARTFNGLLASLETSEWSILNLFEQLSYRHYKSKDLEAMLRTKFRIRYASLSISDELRPILSDEIIKKIFKVERIDLLNTLFTSRLILPLTMDNIIYIINNYFLKDSKIYEITPAKIMSEFK